MPISTFFMDLEYKYTPARLQKHEKTGYCIVFDVKNPSTGKFKRYKRKVNELRKLYPINAEFRAACEIAVNEYNQRLAEGWNPLEDNNNRIQAETIQAQIQSKEYTQAEVSAHAQAQVLQIMTQMAVQNMTSQCAQSVVTPIMQPNMQAAAAVQSTIKPATVAHPVSTPFEQLPPVVQPIRQSKEKLAEAEKSNEQRDAPMKSKIEAKNETPIIISEESMTDIIEQRGLMTVKECLKKWLIYKKNLRPDTLRSYNSIAKMLREWTGEKCPDITMREFTRTHANLFMEYLDETGLGARSYNNYLGNVRTFFSWACSKEYCEYNPFDKIADKQVEEKFRDIIPLEDLTKIREYFDEKLPQFVTVMLLIYFGGMRPKEITRVRVNQIKLSQQGIEMPGYQTKTHAARVSPLSQELVQRLAEAIKCAKPTDYLIGRDWVPGDTPITTKAFQKRWDKMRKDLGMPMQYQVYSLRDCSAFYRMESKDVTALDTMKALGHKRIYQTLAYADHEVKDLAQRLEDGTPTF